MKKPIKKSRAADQDRLLPEYEFDYGKSLPNRFADAMPRETVAVVLDPEVAAVFQTSEVVNAVLMSIIGALSEARVASGLHS